MLNAIWLETFATLCEVGHFTRAASLLNMTQPGVSQHVKKLEAQVGQMLLSREGKSFTLTPAGEAVLSVALRRREEELALNSSLQYDDPDAGHVSVACSGSLALLLYPCFMDLMAAAPALTIALEATPQSRVLDGVTGGVFDLGIVDHSPTHPRLEGESVGQDELCLILHQDQAEPETFAELDALGFIAHPDGFAYADELLGINFPRQYPGSDRLRQKSFINQIGQITSPVLRGLGFTILQRSGLDAHPGRENLKIMKLSRTVRHDLWLIGRKNRVLPARARKVQTAICSILAPL